MRRLLALSLTLLALPLAACGGDDKDDEPEVDPAKAAFIAKGDEICSTVNDKIIFVNNKLGALRGQGTVAAQFEATAPLLRRSVAIQKQAIEDFRALDVPAEDRETIEAYLTSAEKQGDALETMADAADAKDKEAVEAAQADLDEISEERRAAAQEYGFHKCGGGG